MLIGFLNPTRKENRYILTVADLASRWPESIAMKNIDTESICEILMILFARFDFP